MSVFDGFQQYDEIAKHQLESIDKIRDSAIFEQRIKKMVIYLHLNGRATKTKHFEDYAAIMNHPLFSKAEDEIPEGLLKIDFYSIHQLYNVGISNIEKSLYYCDKLYDYYQENPHLIITRLILYVYHVYNRLFTLLDAKEYGKIEDTLEIYTAIKEKYEQYCSDELKIIITIDAFRIKFMYCIKQGNFDLAKNDVLNCIEYINSDDSCLYNKSREVSLYYLISEIYFGQGDFKNALFWVNKILNSKELQNLHLFASALNLTLLIHYELRNFELIEYLLKFTARYYQKHLEQNLYEFKIFSILKKLVLYIPNTPLDQKIHYTKFRDKFIEEQLSDSEDVNPLTFDYKNWLDSKAENSSISEMIVKKNRIAVG